MQKDKDLAPPVAAPEDAAAIKHLQEAIIGGQHWYLALLEAIGMWSSAEETHQGQTRRYLIDGEAFDWLLLAERLCDATAPLLPREEKNSLIHRGRPPLSLGQAEVRGLIGDIKYRQYLNFFYGVTLEETLHLTVQEEIHKETYLLNSKNELQVEQESYRRIYDATREELLKAFRKEKGYPQSRSITISQTKEFTYWLFKYRLRKCEKARVASDTKKALNYLKRQWQKRGFYGALVNGDTLASS